MINCCHHSINFTSFQGLALVASTSEARHQTLSLTIVDITSQKKLSSRRQKHGQQHSPLPCLLSRAPILCPTMRLMRVQNHTQNKVLVSLAPPPLVINSEQQSPVSQHSGQAASSKVANEQQLRFTLQQASSKKVNKS